MQNHFARCPETGVYIVIERDVQDGLIVSSVKEFSPHLDMKRIDHGPWEMMTKADRGSFKENYLSSFNRLVALKSDFKANFNNTPLPEETARLVMA